jgi:integrase/recombinase XerD
VLGPAEPGTAALTREAYTLDLRQFTARCRARSLPLFSIRRADIETFARELEGLGLTRATVTRRLCTIAGFYKYVVEEERLRFCREECVCSYGLCLFSVAR